MVDCGAIVLSGGRSRRMGQDKAATQVGGQSMLERTIRGLAPHVAQVCVVGEVLELPREDAWPAVSFTAERPRFGGPIAGLAAGLELITSTECFVLPVDLAHPAAVVNCLAGNALGPDGVALQDDQGWVQFLAARYVAESLRKRLQEVGNVDGLSVRRFAEGLDLRLISARNELVADLDTSDDVTRVFGALGSRSQPAG